ncbi:MAG: S58 family peptidase [Chloroflexi bacterium]|nr:MAG: S58 family peptidase [Chloroflexota bacterium]
MTRARLRDLGIVVGDLPTGRHNAITDVGGVRVGHVTRIHDTPRTARTGVTVIVPRDEAAWANNCAAGYHSFNGNGEMTGMAWLDESGMLVSTIGLTNTHQVGLVRDVLVADAVENGYEGGWLLPVVAETYDGWLNDIDAFHLTADDVRAALADASGGAVAEGNVGGGTGMNCHEFKGGIGTASRVITIQDEAYTVGVLVQANYGKRDRLRIHGVPVGQKIPYAHTPAPWPTPPPRSSIIVIVATDAPLLPVQCKRLARRATIGLARVGGGEQNGSGDIFLAFATGNDFRAGEAAYRLKMVSHLQMDSLFTATVEATEEAILNALTAAETMTGFMGRTSHALPLDALQRIMA